VVRFVANPNLTYEFKTARSNTSCVRIVKVYLVGGKKLSVKNYFYHSTIINLKLILSDMVLGHLSLQFLYHGVF